MGLAASQARLLSITARMSDNELRSQLINNAKMRLTADTSKVSDEYIAALNETRLMFSNFDLEGNELYQGLTFSSLTAYSSYNTQYGIVNNAGQLLVSTTDANNYEQSADLKAFLEKYGLEKKTDYFDTLKTSAEFNYVDPETGFKKGIGYYDSYGKWQPLNVTPEEMQAIYEAETYNGIAHYGKTDTLNSIEYGDYQTLADEYATARDNYKSTLKTRMKDWLSGKHPENGGVDLTPGSSTLPDTGRFAVQNSAGDPYEKYVDFESYYGWAMRYAENQSASGLPSYSVDWYKDRLADFAELVGMTRDFALNKGANSENQMLKDHVDDKGYNTAFFTILQKNLDIVNTPAGSTWKDYRYDANGCAAYILTDGDGNKSLYIPSSTTTIGSSPATAGQDAIVVSGYYTNDKVYVPASGGTTVNLVTIDDDCTLEPAYVKNGQYSFPGCDNGLFDDDDGKGWTLVDNNQKTLIVEETPIDDEKRASALKALYNAFRDGLIGNMTDQVFINLDDEVKKARNAYIEAAENLANFIYGEGNGNAIVKSMVDTYGQLEMIDYLDSPEWILSTNAYENAANSAAEINGNYYDVIWDGNTEIDPLNKCLINPFNIQYPTTTAAPTGYDTMDVDYTFYTTDSLGNKIPNIRTQTYGTNYQTVKDLFLIDCMLEHYGEPKYTWIDKNNKEEDGNAKAEWYTNLYMRMQQGYQKIEEGVGNSEDWMKFAFESGLVHMEQVNHSAEWISTLYSNCSNITESTVDVNVTIAEAKYKREMAKIQAKDKQYDIELKNIDTEHESLKQEYESIKTVIDNNIKQNMKLFVQS